MSKIAIIPARGGSKRIPKKNIRNFLGKPIITYAIDVAIGSKIFDEVIVSTDSEEIAAIARDSGAKVPFMRSQKNSDDYATTFEVIEEVILKYREKNDYFDYGCCIYPCTPLLKEENIIKSFDKLIENDYDLVFPIVKYSFPIQRALKTTHGLAMMIQPEHITTRSQDLEDSYHDVGQFYSFKVDKLMRKKSLLTDNTSFIEISELESQDIDNIEDWNLAELKYSIINK
tara:strand:- start:3596 stop:4282 length:687 start_codon:yes stop_codon:yes gene_type:complete